MQCLSYAHRTAWTVIATFIIAGCAGGTAQVVPTSATQAPNFRARSTELAQQSGRGGNRLPFGHAVTTPSFMDPNASTKPLVFVSDADSEVVNIYLQGGKNKLVGQITGLLQPYAIATDSARNLYVANADEGNVQVYEPPYTGAPNLTLNDEGYEPYDVAISPRGVIGVTNYCIETACNAGSGNLVFYAANSTTPCATVSDAKDFAYMEFGAFDRKGNFFINGFDANRHSTLGEIKGGCNAKGVTILTAGENNGVLGGIHINKADQISIFDTEPPGSGAPVIYTYRQPTKHSLGSPISTTVLQGTNRVEILEDFAFQGSGKDLYVPDSVDGLTNEYAYPAGGMPERTITSGSAYISGIAVTPPLTP